MLKILAFDSSTEMCSVALQQGEEILLRQQLAPQKHAELILPMIDELLVEAQMSLSDLDAFAFGCGPGSFMGLRIGAGVVQGLAYAVNKPVISVSSLQCLAQSAFQAMGTPALVAGIDARMKAIYWACYRLDAEGVMQAITPDTLSAPEEILVPEDEFSLVVGKAWETYGSQLRINIQVLYPEVYPMADAMLAIAQQKGRSKEWLKAEEVEPTYIRDRVTHT